MKTEGWTYGGAPPALGTTLCMGFKANDNFTAGTVISVVETTYDGYTWAAIVQPLPGGYTKRLQLITNVDLYVGSWRAMDRADESPNAGDETQKALRATWRAQAEATKS